MDPMPSYNFERCAERNRADAQLSVDVDEAYIGGLKCLSAICLHEAEELGKACFVGRKGGLASGPIHPVPLA
jgi:hypothetical protein